MLATLSPKARTLLALPIALALIAGCGGDSDPTSSTTAAPSAESFPAAGGKTLAKLTDEGTERLRHSCKRIALRWSSSMPISKASGLSSSRLSAYGSPVSRRFGTRSV